MIERRFTMEQVRDAVDPQPMETTAETLLKLHQKEHYEEFSLASKASVIHRFNRFQISDTPQKTLKGPVTTFKDRKGGSIDQIILLVSMYLNEGISCRILKASNNQESWYTLEVLVDEANTKENGVPASDSYELRESMDHEEMYWTPADPMLCNHPGDLETLEEKNLIEKQGREGRKFYSWKNLSDRYICHA